MKKENKRGLSPVVATVLLIAMVIVVGLVIFLWFRGITEEVITKFDGTNIKLACGDVQFDAGYSAGTLLLSNIGNVPIYGMKMKIEKQGSYATEDLSSGWPEAGLDQGATYSGDVSSAVSSGDKLTLIPVLIGSAQEGGEKTHSCEERYGQSILI